MSRQVYELSRVLGTTDLPEPARRVMGTVIAEAFRHGVVHPEAVRVEVRDEAFAASIWHRSPRGRSLPLPERWREEVDAVLRGLARTPLHWSVDDDTPWRSTLVRRWSREGGVYTVDVSRLLLRLAARLRPRAT